MSKKHWIVTANRLTDGGVVYLDADRGWTDDVSRASLADAEDGCADGLAWAHGQQATVCDPYVIAVSDGQTGPRPLTARERIRAEGPEPTLRRLGYLARKAS